MRASRLATLVLLAASGVASAQSTPPSKAQIEEINRQFGGRMITAKMDLPIVRSVYVRPDGEYDQERYQDRLASQPPSIPRNDMAKLTKIEVDGDKINVNINGGGMPKPRGRTMMIIGGRKNRGSRIEIEFGRRVTAADLTPELIVRAVSRVIAIEGMEASTALARPDELLAPLAGGATPSAAAGEAAGARPAPEPATPPATPPATSPANAAGTLEIVSAEVTPTRLRAGERLALSAHYEVSGLAGSATMTVVEERQLTFDGKPLFSQPLTERVQRANGRHASTFDFNVPAGATPGVYTFTVTVRTADASASREALFQIVP